MKMWYIIVGVLVLGIAVAAFLLGFQKFAGGVLLSAGAAAEAQRYRKASKKNIAVAQAKETKDVAKIHKDIAKIQDDAEARGSTDTSADDVADMLNKLDL